MHILFIQYLQPPLFTKKRSALKYIKHYNFIVYRKAATEVLRSDYVDVHADQKLNCLHMSEGPFSLMCHIF